MEEYKNYQLAGESQLLMLENSSDNYGVALSMLQQTRRDVGSEISC